MGLGCWGGGGGGGSSNPNLEGFVKIRGSTAAALKDPSIIQWPAGFLAWFVCVSVSNRDPQCACPEEVAPICMSVWAFRTGKSHIWRKFQISANVSILTFFQISNIPLRSDLIWHAKWINLFCQPLAHRAGFMKLRHFASLFRALKRGTLQICKKSIEDPVELLHFSHFHHVWLVHWTNHLLPATGDSGLAPRGGTRTLELGLPISAVSLQWWPPCDPWSQAIIL